MDARTRREWEKSLGKSSAPPSYEELHDFLHEQLVTQEALKVSKGDAAAGTKPVAKPGRSARANHAGNQAPESGRSCPVCKKDHFLAFCDIYRKKPAQERREVVAANQRCSNCLGRHAVSDCASQKSCGRCSGRHHTTLHDAFVVASAPNAVPTSSIHVADQSRVEDNVLLATARVLVVDRNGVKNSVRALLDPGSDSSLMSESLAQRLRLPRTPTSISIFGVGGVQSGYAHGRITLTLSARTGSFSMAVAALVLPRLTAYRGACGGRGHSWPHVTGLDLADPDFARGDMIELLLGADAYANILLPGLRRGGPREPIAQETQLGWVLLGALGADRSISVATALQCSATDTLDRAVRRFWEWEEPPRPAAILSADEQECEEHFHQTHRRLPDGRYQVRLPFRAELPDLASTNRAALRMLETMERRFARDAGFQTLYRAFMDDYASMGHMSPFPLPSTSAEHRECYLPHHGVLKTTAAGAKIRVVFNGSCLSRSGVSLNDVLHTGPNLLPALTDVILRWRQHRYVFSADVEKMYRQIQVHPEDRGLQRVLWRANGELTTFALNTVTYGLACAPYLAIRVLRQLAEDERDRFPLGGPVLQRDTYMDDVLAGASTLEECERLRDQVAALCMAGGFPLKKWAANHAALLGGIPSADRWQPAAGTILPAIDHAVLGIRWNPASDDFAITVGAMEAACPTKRVILSKTARLFDPLGWLAPVVVRAKLLIQTTWLQHLDWDTPVPAKEAAAWSNLEEELPLLTGVRVPRWFGCDVAHDALEIHGFADASERAYAAVVYLRVCRAGRTSVSLALAKTKVADLRRFSLPRLELCAATLLAKLSEYVRSTLSLDSVPVTNWSDSTTVLGWLRGHPARWTTFVANRVAEIHRTAPNVAWRHVPGLENPADCASRGTSPRELIEHPLWWSGPAFLMADAATWPCHALTEDLDDLPEQRPLLTRRGREGRETDRNEPYN